MQVDGIGGRDVRPMNATNQQHEYVLAETRLEERDGATWVSGLCPFCWERIAFHAPPRGSNAEMKCPNGHLVLVTEQTSEGTGANRTH